MYLKIKTGTSDEDLMREIPREELVQRLIAYTNKHELWKNVHTMKDGHPFPIEFWTELVPELAERVNEPGLFKDPSFTVHQYKDSGDWVVIHWVYANKKLPAEGDVYGWIFLHRESEDQAYTQVVLPETYSVDEDGTLRVQVLDQVREVETLVFSRSSRIWPAQIFLPHRYDALGRFGWLLESSPDNPLTGLLRSKSPNPEHRTLLEQLKQQLDRLRWDVSEAYRWFTRFEEGAYEVVNMPFRISVEGAQGRKFANSFALVAGVVDGYAGEFILFTGRSITVDSHVNVDGACRIEGVILPKPAKRGSTEERPKIPYFDFQRQRHDEIPVKGGQKLLLQPMASYSESGSCSYPITEKSGVRRVGFVFASLAEAIQCLREILQEMGVPKREVDAITHMVRVRFINPR